jgi:predicted transcriptional regulator
MRVLLSIKPEFAEMIFSGKKKYEYRRQIFKKNIQTVVVYASSPVQKIIGEFTVEKIDYNELSVLWKNTKEHSGITSDYFFSYFANKDHGYAIKIENVNRYHKEIDIRKAFGMSPPQSFAYIR